MTRDDFWKLIESSKDAEDIFEQVEEIQSSLESMPADEILSFEQHLSAIMAESYRNELWGQPISSTVDARTMDLTIFVAG